MKNKNCTFEYYYDLQFFADDSGTGEKTEDASPRKIRKAREKGDVAKSTDLVTAIILLTSVIFFYWYGSYFITNLKGVYLYYLTFSNTDYVSNFGIFISTLFQQFMMLISPLFAVIIITSILANISQFGILFTLEPLKPNIGKLNPISGVKKIFSLNSVNELVKSIFKLAILSYIPYDVVSGNYLVLKSLVKVPLMVALSGIFTMIFEIAIKICIILIILAIIDFLYQKWQYNKKLKMSKYDVRQERKEMEGDPRQKAEMRRRAMDMLMKSMMAKVPEADVVITNPTHIAVALKYDTEKSGVPYVMAMGEGYIAQKIKEIAKENNIPIIEDKPLARMLFKTTDVGSPIPEALYDAIATILAEVYRLQGRTL